MSTLVNRKLVKQMSRVVAALAIAFAAGQARANNLFGIDVSSFQGNVDWSAAHGGGVQFAFAKATEGNYYVDAYLDRNMKTGKLRGIKMGAYHFARPDLDCVSTEANYFWSHAGGYILADGKTIFPVIDFEVFNGHSCQNSYTDWMNTWSDDVKGNLPTSCIRSCTPAPAPGCAMSAPPALSKPGSPITMARTSIPAIPGVAAPVAITNLRAPIIGSGGR